MGLTGKRTGAVRILGKHYRPPAWLHWLCLAVGAIFLVVAAVSGDEDAWASAAVVLVLGAMIWLMPDVHIDERGIRRLFTRRIPWAEVARVERPTRWQFYVRLHRHNGRVNTLRGLRSKHVPGLRRLAGLVDDPAELFTRLPPGGPGR